MTCQAGSKDTITRDAVLDISGKEIGKLEGVMLDTESGQIIYGVINFADSNKKDVLCAIRWSDLKKTGTNRYTLAIAAKNMEGVLTFSKENMPEQADINSVETIYNHYDHLPYLEKAKIRKDAAPGIQINHSYSAF